MQITFPAMRAKMGGREYYSTLMSLSEIPRFFKFSDWDEFTPELRAQRVLNESRIPEIAHYISEHEDDYLFSSITCSYTSDLKFESYSNDNPDIGNISLELEQMEFVINDGQHRCAAIAQAIKDNPTVATDKISVLLFPMENMERMQQMFSDLNRFAQRTPRSLNILYDHRDNLANISKNLAEKIDVFRGMIDFEKPSLQSNSHKLFTLTSLYEANKEFEKRISIKNEDYKEEELETILEEYWKEVSDRIPDWKKVKAGKIPAKAIRQEKINSHAIVLRALGAVGGILLRVYKEEWREKIALIQEIDWRKSIGTKVNPAWDGICITAGSVVSNIQARNALFVTFCEMLDIESKATKKTSKSSRSIK
ncbi:MAG: DNA sulfur modification protein DndB [Gammaproteobacteria bacterium]